MQPEGISAGRVAFNRVVTGALDGLEAGLFRRWLAIANACLGVLLGLAMLAPAFLFLGLDRLADPIYWAYQAVCHQWSFRSFFLFGPQVMYSSEEIVARFGSGELWTFVGSAEAGYKMAFCERNTAIAAAALAMGIFYTRYRSRLAPPKLRFYLVLLFPILVDGLTQLFGFRESTWELRVATGALAGAATVWLLYPYLEVIARWRLRDLGA